MILVCIWLFYIINNIIWLYFNESGLIYDSLKHFLLSIKIFDWLKQGNFPYLSDVILYVFPQQRWHGVLVGYLVAPFYFLFGKSENAGVFVNGALSLGILLFSVYGICEKITNNKKIGILAAFIATQYPLIFTHSRTFELDLPLTAIVALSIYLLLLTDYFSNRKYSILFGVVSGLGMLTKFNFSGFLAAPFLLTCFKGQKRRWMNIIISLSIIFIISIKFYLLKAQEVLARIDTTSWIYIATYYNQSQRLAGAWLKTCREYFSWLSGDIINNSLSFLFTAVFLASLIPFMKVKVKDKAILWLWLLVPLSFLSLFFHKPLINRYIMPILPAMAIISAIGINAIRYARIKNVTVLLIIILGCFQYIAISYSLPLLPEKIEISISVLKKVTLFNRSINNVHRNTIPPFSYPAKISWKEDEILEAIQIDSNSQLINLFFVDAVPEVYSPLISKTAIRELPLNIFYIPLINEDSALPHMPDPFYRLSLADYVLIKKDNFKSHIWQDRITVKGWVKEEIAATRRIFYAYLDRFELIKKINLPDPDETILQLYKKKQSPAQLSIGYLTISFRDGLIKAIYSKDRTVVPLTIFTRFNYAQRRYASFHAEWNVEVTNDEIIATGIFKDLSLIQKCSVKLINDNALFWKIDLSSSNGLNISDAESEIIVRHPYKELSDLKDFRQVRLKGHTVGNHYFPEIILKALGERKKFIVPQLSNKFVRGFKLYNSQSASLLTLEGEIIIGEQL